MAGTDTEADTALHNTGMNMSRGGGSVPVPDPTALTTEALQREVAIINERILSQVSALQELLGARLEAMDIATNLRLEALHQIPSRINEEIQHLADLHVEKFAGIHQQFNERDIRTEQQARASKEALDAALLAAKELVGATNLANAAAAAKAEDNFTKQIDQIGTLITTLEKSLNDRITEIKERIDRGPGEQASVNRDDQRYRIDQNRLSTGTVIAMFGLALIIILGATDVILALAGK